MKNIVAFDVETTGIDTSKDFVIQLSAVKFDNDFNEVGMMNFYILPVSDFEIRPEAQEKHGLDKSFIIDNGTPLAIAGKEFLDFIEGCDMLSYNGNSFDVKILSKDLRSVGLDFPLDKTFYDSMLLETKLFPRTLDATYKKYTGKDLEGAHNSLNDVYATIEVFKHQLDRFADQYVTLDDIMGFDESKIFDVDGMIKKEGDSIVFRKGKYRGVEFMNVAKEDPGYVKWFMTNKDFSDHTKNILRNYYITNRKANA